MLRHITFRYFTVKIGQAYPPRFYYWIDYLKNESVCRSRNWCQIQSGISACVMSSEYFTRTSLYLVRLEIFEWIKLLRRHLHQFLPAPFSWNWCKCLLRSLTHSKISNLTKYREVLVKYSLLITHAEMPLWIWHQLWERLTDSFFK